ncbi:pilus biogenesis protein, TadE family [Cystobacter fuscus DSM 2262]|uniref:Pilus biogenesis protein, TadE family n=1 Tax=Cystobacter fuscus (strain ATCC 25194 / DSM 2262 / NBRC 100088 / M29) TaxID=1242864 RepID=S9P5D3_CYSF2|nr:TadE family protein [Cystobacter fuscus]EPX59625.1 pilus biogenesis protein, TadE family [Cystobacter fuscus DSM 2262]
MLRSRAHKKTVRRGAAIVEFALVVPLLVSILMFSMFLSDIIRAKLKMQEASRYTAWEMSSYTLSDYGSADHDKAFETAQKAAVDEATERYKDLDSLEPDGKFGFMLSAEPVQVKVENQTVAGIDLSRVFEGNGGIGGEASSAVGKTLNFFLDHFKMNTKGQVQVEITSKLASLGLPRNYLQQEQKGFFDVDNWGGKDLSNLPVKNRYTLIATGWQLPDGANAVMAPKRAGVHSGGESQHGMAAQVDRMTFLGVGNYADKVGLDALGSIANFVFPDFFGPFVVAHNYEPSAEGNECNKPGHGASVGLNNLNKYPGLDDDAQRCFDTAPFRDTQKYDDSLYRKVFMARGNSFMGCKNEQADMPNTPAPDPSVQKDKNKKKVSCE